MGKPSLLQGLRVLAALALATFFEKTNHAFGAAANPSPKRGDQIVNGWRVSLPHPGAHHGWRPKRRTARAKAGHSRAVGAKKRAGQRRA